MSEVNRRTKVIRIKRRKTSINGKEGEKPIIKPQPALNVSQQNPPNVVYTTNEEESPMKQQVQIPSYEFTGPQLRLSKNNISFRTNTTQAVNQQIQIRNVGSTAIKYEWLKVQNEKYYQNSLVDSEERFFCHHKKNVIRPGQVMDFSFSFKSQVEGVFYEEWEIKTEPFCLHQLEKVKFTGMCIQQDNLIDNRIEMNQFFEKSYKQIRMSEMVEDIIENVKTPEGEPLDYTDKQVQKEQFQLSNRTKNLYHTQLGVNWFQYLRNMLLKELNIQQDSNWDMNVESIRSLIDRLRFDEEKEYIEKLYSEFLDFSRLRPYDQSPFYQFFYKMIENLAFEIVDYQKEARAEMEIWDIDFKGFDNETEDSEIIKFKEDREKAKQEFLKKAKKKKWTDDDEKQAIEQVHEKVQNRIQGYFQQKLENIDSEQGQYLESMYLLKNQPIYNYKYFNQLLNKKHMVDQDIDDRKIILRVHLKIKDGPENYDKKLFYEQQVVLLEEQKKRIEEQRLKMQQEESKKKRNKNKTMAQTVVEEELIELDYSFLDMENINNIFENVGFLLNNNAKLVILLVSYDKPLGKIYNGGSVKFLQEMLIKNFENTQVIFHDQDIFIDNYFEKIENDYYGDNSIILMENLFFCAQEVGQYSDSQGKLVKLENDQKQKYIQELPSYGSLYVVEDKFNLFSSYTSINRFKSDYNVVGIQLSQQFSVLGHCLNVERQLSLAMIGGMMNSQKCLAVNQLANQFKQVYLFGEIGFKFGLVANNINQFGGMSILGWEQQMIEQLINMNSNLVIPTGIVIIKKVQQQQEQLQEMTEEQQQQQQVGQDTQYERQEIIFAEYQENEESQQLQAVDFIEKDQNGLQSQIESTQKILWIDKLCIKDEFCNLDMNVSNQLYLRQQDKQVHIKQDKNTYHNYSKDLLITISGKELEDLLNQFQFEPDEEEEIEQEVDQEEMDEDFDNDQEDEEKVVHKQKKKKQRNNMRLVSDFYAKDSYLMTQLLSGQYCQALENIDQYDLLDDRDNNEQFSFIDEI